MYVTNFVNIRVVKMCKVNGEACYHVQWHSSTHRSCDEREGTCINMYTVDIWGNASSLASLCFVVNRVHVPNNCTHIGMQLIV